MEVERGVDEATALEDSGVEAHGTRHSVCLGGPTPVLVGGECSRWCGVVCSMWLVWGVGGGCCWCWLDA